MPRVFHPIPNASVAIFRWKIDATLCETLFGYVWNNSVIPSPAELLTLATEVFQTIQPKYALFWHNRVSATECYARNLNVEHANEATFSPVGPFSGTRGGNATPASVGAAHTKRTGLTGYRQHGWFMYSGFSGNDIGGDFLGAQIINTIASLATSELAVRAGGRFIPALLSYKDGNAKLLRELVLRNTLVDDSGKRLPDPH